MLRVLSPPPLSRRWVVAGRFLLVAALILVPCFWHPRIQAGDLASHSYNTWLASLIRQGKLPGLEIVFQPYNILFDLIVEALAAVASIPAAEKLAASIAVSVFFWGAFAFAASLSSPRLPWAVTPWLAMLAYGFVFHLGFLNFYLGLGLGLFALFFLQANRKIMLLPALLFLALAFVAHPVSALWALATGLYLLVWRITRARLRLWLLPAGAIVLVTLIHVLRQVLPSVWVFRPIYLLAGADQFSVFNDKYLPIVFGMFFLWGSAFAHLAMRSHWRELFDSPAVQLMILNTMGLVLVPAGIMPPGMKSHLGYVPDRLSLAVAVCTCTLLASARQMRWQKVLGGGLAAVYFFFLFADTRAIGLLARRVEATLAPVPYGTSVISTISESGTRFDPLVHLAEQVCVARCFSYTNYEPASGHFRIRTLHSNPFVISDHNAWFRLRQERYVVTPSDVPLYVVVPLDQGAQRLVLKELKAGDTVPVFPVQVLPDLRQTFRDLLASSPQTRGDFLAKISP